MILKIDEALLEARLARDAMLLYIQVRLFRKTFDSNICLFVKSSLFSVLLQFIKDCAYDVAASENTTTVPGAKPDIALR